VIGRHLRDDYRSRARQWILVGYGHLAGPSLRPWYVPCQDLEMRTGVMNNREPLTTVLSTVMSSLVCFCSNSWNSPVIILLVATHRSSERAPYTLYQSSNPS
jgi:hypothetical protein